MASCTNGEEELLLSNIKSEVASPLCQEDDISQSGLTVWTAALILFACGFGVGIVTLPHAYQQLGPIIGSIVYCILALLCAIFAVLLSVSYLTVMQDDHSQTKGDERAPYRDMMEAAFGKTGRYLLTIVLTFKLFASAVTLLLLSKSTVLGVFHKIDSSYPILAPPWVVSLVLTIITGLGLLYRSPKSLKWISSVATAASTILSVLVIESLVYMKQNNNITPRTWIKKETTAMDAFTAIGVMLFNLNFTFALPTVQVDMVDPAKMKRGSFITYLALGTTLAVPMLTAYYLIDGEIQPSLLDTLGRSRLYKGDVTFKVLVTICQIALTIHCVAAVCPIINPLCQLVENIFNLPVNFTWHRVISRFTIIFLAFLVEVFAPGFVHILSINGGLFVIQLTITFPALIYERIQSDIAVWKKVMLWLTATIAVLLSLCIAVVGFLNIGEKS